MGIIDWLNTNRGAIIGIAIVLLVGVIGYYAYFERYKSEGIVAVNPATV